MANPKILTLAWILMFLLIAPVAPAQDINEANVLACCKAISKNSTSVLFPAGDGLYTVVNDDRWSNTSILKPACIILPETTAEVAGAVKVLVSGANGANSSCLFAIKAGGHTAYPGANDINGGVSLDLSWLNRTMLAADRKSATIGSGSSWGHVYEHLDAAGATAPGGLCYSTGVGGLTLGGGISIFAPRVGFSADNVIDYEVVVASGEITNANASHNGDLFRALKGGSGNFGVVTRFTMAAFDQSKLWGGHITIPYTPHAARRALSVVTNFTKMNNVQQDAAYSLSFSYNGTSGAKEIVNWLTYSNDVGDLNIVQPVLSSAPQKENTMRLTTMADLASEGEAMLPGGSRYLMATATFINNLRTLFAVQNITDGLYNNMKDMPGLDFVVMYEPLPHAIWQRSEQHGGNMLGLNGTDDLIVVMLAPRWTSAAHDERVREATANWSRNVAKATRLLGTESSFLYLNYADGSQNPLRSYGNTSVAFMQQVARKYDPNGVFQRLVPGGFKISMA